MAGSLSGNRIPIVLLAGAVWGALGGGIEVILLERHYHAFFRPWLHAADLLLNYSLYGVAGIALFFIVLRFMLRTPHPARAAVAWFLPVPALAVIGWYGATLGLSTAPLLTTVMSIFGIVALLGMSLWLYKTSARARTVSVFVAAMIVLLGIFKDPVTSVPGALLRGLGTAGSNTRNVVLILTDTLRADYLSCYGHDWNTSPVLDKLAEGGALFDRHISQSTWTLPATASVLTGLYPSSHGARTEGSALPPGAETLAEVFRRAGYHTAAFTENRYVTPRFGFGQGFDTFRPFWDPWLYKSTLLSRARKRIPVLDLTSKEIYPADLKDPEQLRWDARETTNRALDWLDATGEKPFFLYVHYMNPHGPYGPRDFLLTEKESPGKRLADHPRDKGGPYPLRPPAEPLPDKELEDLITLYAADIRYVDDAVGRLLAALDARGLRDETLVIFTADHGEEFYEHGSWNHGASAFQSVVHVPLIMSAPGLIPEGVRVGAVTRAIDVLPTALDLTSLQAPERAQGRSLRGYLGLGTPPVPIAAYTEGAHHTLPEEIEIEAVTTEDWKLMRVSVAADEAVLLYDLAGDPNETADLAGSNPAMRDSLLRELDRWNRAARLYSPETREIALDPATVEELRALGYVK